MTPTISSATPQVDTDPPTWDDMITALAHRGTKFAWNSGDHDRRPAVTWPEDLPSYFEQADPHTTPDPETLGLEIARRTRLGTQTPDHVMRDATRVARAATILNTYGKATTARLLAEQPRCAACATPVARGTQNVDQLCLGCVTLAHTVRADLALDQRLDDGRTRREALIEWLTT